MRKRTTVRVIAPTEWVQLQDDNVVEVARWLGDRGVHCELAFRGDGPPTLWRGSALGRDVVRPGQWVGVQVLGQCTVVDDGELDNTEKYQEVPE